MDLPLDQSRNPSNFWLKIVFRQQNRIKWRETHRKQLQTSNQRKQGLMGSESDHNPIIP